MINDLMKYQNIREEELKIRVAQDYFWLYDVKHDIYNFKRAEFSETAKKVFKAGRELWKYYHKQPKCNVNASLYDIHEYFQGIGKRRTAQCDLEVKKWRVTDCDSET